jgi:hypothetical protein
MSIRRYFSLFLILSSVLVLASCQSGGNQSSTEPAQEIQIDSGQPAVTTGPFRAMATSAISVDLSWDVVDGATGYRIENSFADSEWFVIAELGGEATSFEDFLTPSDMELNYRLTPLMGDQDGKALNLIVTTPELIPNPFRVVAIREEPDFNSISLELPGFDPSTFDPSTFDPSTLDLSGIDNENLDLTSLQPESVSARSRIGPEGGTFSVTGKNGVIYTLDIPPDALDFSTYFVLTPIADIEGYPFSEGFLGAVDIQPEGIIFDIPVMLTITFPEELVAALPIAPEIVQMAFAYERGGEEFHLTPLAPESLSTTENAPDGNGKVASPNTKGPTLILNIPASRTQAVGAGNGKPKEFKSHAATQASTNSSFNASQMAAIAQLAEELIRYDEKQDYDSRVPARRRAAEIYQWFKKASNIAYVSHAILDLQEFFYSPDFSKLTEVERDTLLDTAAILLKNWLQPVECPSTEAGIIQAWVRRLRNPVNDFDKALRSHMQKAYPVEADNWLRAIDSVKGCKVQLRMESTVITGDAEASCRYKMIVKVIVPLSWKLNGGYPILQGGPPQGEYNIKYEPKIDILSEKTDAGWCSKVEYAGLAFSEFVVLELIPKFDKGGQTQQDWLLRSYRMAGDVVKATLTTSYPPPEPDNVGSGSIPEGGDPWGGVMALIRTQGKETPGTVGVENWKLTGSGENAILATWKGEGNYTDMANYHHHDTKLWIEIQ